MFLEGCILAETVDIISNTKELIWMIIVDGVSEE